jgi:hypothetical protein
MKPQDLDWVQIPGFPDYYINWSGAVLSYRLKTERQLTPTPRPNGWYVQLFSAEGRPKNISLQRLMLMAFKPLRAGGKYVAWFKDEDPQNLTLENLEWRPVSRVRPKAKLTEEQAVEMRRLYTKDASHTYDTLAQRYGVSRSTVRSVLAKETWYDVASAPRLK